MKLKPIRTTRMRWIALVLCMIILPTCMVQPARARSYSQSISKSGPKGSYTLNTTDMDLLVSNTGTLTVDGISDEEVSFKCEDTDIVSITNAGNGSCSLTGVSVGETTVTIKVKKKNALFFTKPLARFRCDVTVSPKAASISFKKKVYKTVVNKTVKPKLVIRPSITSERPVYTIANPEIATVNKKGRVSGISAGITTLTATIQNGMSVQCKIIVKNPKKKTSSTNHFS